jgi:cell cycle protein kinase DBF2
LGYVAARKERRTAFDKDTADRHLNALERAKEFKSYCGRERVILRKRRTKLKVNQFHIIAQVGQGGYGEVYLARKQDSGEVCALKKMRKRTLFKMDEVSTCQRDLHAMVVTLENRSATSWLNEIS